MTNIFPTLVEQTSDHITFKLDNLNPGMGVYVCYDIFNYETSTGMLFYTSSNLYRGNYYIWRCQSSTGGIFRIDNTTIVNVQLAIDYTQLSFMQFEIFPWIQYMIFDMFATKIDMVSRRYPETFEKKFSLHEMDLCIEAALADINLFPPLTTFWFKFSSFANASNFSMSPYQQDMGVPFELWNIIATGSLIQALVSQGILEVDVNFSYSDQGISITYQNMDAIKGWWSSILEQFNKDRASMKQTYWSPTGVGTVPFSLSLPGVVQTLLGSLSTAGFPWWRAFSLGRPQ